MGTGANTGSQAVAGPVWMQWQDVQSAKGDETLTGLATWFQTYVMQPHLEVGRSGHVCPYMAPATRQNLVRMTVSDIEPDDDAGLRAILTRALALYDTIDCPEAKRIFRTVIVAFPAHTGADSIARLEKAQHAVRYRAAVKGLMVGLFEPDSSQPGIVNRPFRSFRSPIALVAVRTLVEGDAPFVLRNPLMIPMYVARFGASGRRRLYRAFAQRLKARWSPPEGVQETA